MKYAESNRKAQAVFAAERKANFLNTPQRVGGGCEPMEDRKSSTFQAAGESRKGQPFIAETRGSIFFGQFGWQRGKISSRPCFDAGMRAFLV